MSHSHRGKFITKAFAGFLLITAGILLVYYSVYERDRKEDWYLWGIVASVIINAGLYFLITGFVHKIKSDFIRRQKQREQQKGVKSDSESRDIF